jgi:hypothetical protein
MQNVKAFKKSVKGFVAMVEWYVYVFAATLSAFLCCGVCLIGRCIEKQTEPEHNIIKRKTSARSPQPEDDSKSKVDVTLTYGR